MWTPEKMFMFLLMRIHPSFPIWMATYQSRGEEEILQIIGQI